MDQVRLGKRMCLGESPDLGGRVRKRRSCSCCWLVFFCWGWWWLGGENEWVIPVLFLVGWDKHSVADGWWLVVVFYVLFLQSDYHMNSDWTEGMVLKRSQHRIRFYALSVNITSSRTTQKKHKPGKLKTKADLEILPCLFSKTFMTDGHSTNIFATAICQWTSQPPEGSGCASKCCPKKTYSLQNQHSFLWKSMVGSDAFPIEKKIVPSGRPLGNFLGGYIPLMDEILHHLGWLKPDKIVG